MGLMAACTDPFQLFRMAGDNRNILLLMTPIAQLRLGRLLQVDIGALMGIMAEDTFPDIQGTMQKISFPGKVGMA